MGRQDRHYYYGIDLIRFVAALMVAFFHIGYSCWASPTSGGRFLNPGVYSIPEVAPYAWFGWTGVEIFFVISGFVIINSAAGATAWSFARSRMLRLYPAVWICATMTAILLVSTNLLDNPQRYFSSLLLLPAGPWIDGQYWTLGVEIIFYLLVFAMLSLRKFDRVGDMAVLLIAYSAVANILPLVDHRFVRLAVGDWRLTLGTYGAFFGMGVLIQQWASGRMRPVYWGALLLGLAVAVIETRTHTLEMSARATTSTVAIGERWHIASLATLIGIGAIMLAARWHAAFEALPAPARTMLRAVGLATYPVYLVHFSLGIWITRSLVLLGVQPLAALFLAITLVAALGLAIAQWWEPPVRGALRAVLARAEQRLQPAR